MIDKRIANLRRGTLGDFKFFDTLLELRIDYGPGYRIYCGKKGKTYVARAYGGMAALSQKAGLIREALYQTLSKRGNPTLAKLESLLDALGFRLKIERK